MFENHVRKLFWHGQQKMGEGVIRRWRYVYTDINLCPSDIFREEEDLMEGHVVCIDRIKY